MNDLVVSSATLPIPAMVAAAGERAGVRFLEFFTAQIRNPHTRRAYARAAAEFLAWCESRGVASLAQVQPLHVAAWIELEGREASAPTVKQKLAAIRHLFDWLVTGQVVPLNPAASVRGPRHVVRSGKTPVLESAEARRLLDAIDTSTSAGLRDRALIGLMVYSFARDRRCPGHEGRGRLHAERPATGCGCTRKAVRIMPCPAITLSKKILKAYIEGAGLAADPKGLLFRTIGRGTRALTRYFPAPGQCSCHDPSTRRGRRHRDEGGQSQFQGHRASRHTSRTAARSRRPRTWPTTPAPAPPSSMIADATKRVSTTLSGY